MLALTDDACYAAMVARDPRFDGVFFVCVATTGIYCRPICPARTPGRTRVSFRATPAACEAAGFRACFRCRPELAPGNADVDAVDALVARCTRRIADGALTDGSVDELAAELGVSARHLRRATEARLGVSPIELALSRRLGLAKQLLQDTALPITQVAYAAGFRSVRRFNAAFAERMHAAPTAIRRAHGEGGADATLRLDVREPYDWEALLGFLRVRAVPGVEVVGSDRYRRVVAIAGVTGVIGVRRHPTRAALLLDVSPALVPHLLPIVARVRRQFDVDARPDMIARVLSADPLLAPLVARAPGLRLPGAFDPFEAAIRALLGQQVSVAAATTIAGRFAAALGSPFAGGDGLTTRFPTAAEVARTSVDRIAVLGMPGARAAAVLELARAVTDKRVRLDDMRDLDAFVAALVALPGIGPWTANYLAMRALHVPDAFPAADLGVLKALALTPREAEARAEAWRPYRSYAVMHLWSKPGDTHVRTADEDDRESGRRAAPARAQRRTGGRVRGDADAARGAAGPRVDPRPRRRAARRVLRG